MDQLLAKLDWAVIISGALALIGVLVSVWLSTSISQRTIYINSVTAQRSKWIDTLRENISKLSGLSRTMHIGRSDEPLYWKTDEHKRNLSAINQLVSLIKLQLNPNGTVDANIIQLLEWLPLFAAGDHTIHMVQVDNLLIEHSQWLLKNEWEKVKYEARVFGRWKLRRYEKQREIEYIEFCKTHDIRSAIRLLNAGQR